MIDCYKYLIVQATKLLILHSFTIFLINTTSSVTYNIRKASKIITNFWNLLLIINLSHTIAQLYLATNLSMWLQLKNY